MDDFFNNNSGDNSAFRGRSREEDLAAKKKLEEIKRIIEELKKQSQSREKAYEQTRKDTEAKLDSALDNIVLDLEGNNNHSDGYLARVLQALYDFFSPIFNIFGIDLGPNFFYQLREKKNRSFLISMIKAIIDNLKKLSRKLFARDLTWHERLEKEIAEIEEALDSGNLSEEDTVKNLERLDFLKKIKLRFQLFAIGLMFTTIFSILGFEFAVEASEKAIKEADEEVEKTASQETGKQEGPIETKKIEEHKEFLLSAGNLIKPLADLQKFVALKKEPEVIKPNLALSKLLIYFPPKLEEKLVKQEIKQEKPQPVELKPEPKVATPVPVKPVKSLSGPSDSCQGQREVNNTDKMEVLTIKSTDTRKISNIRAKIAKRIAAKEKSHMNEQNVAKAESINEKVRSELGEINKVENISCGRSV